MDLHRGLKDSWKERLRMRMGGSLGIMLWRMRCLVRGKFWNLIMHRYIID